MMTPRKKRLLKLLPMVRGYAESQRGQSITAEMVAKQLHVKTSMVRWCFMKLNHEGLMRGPSNHSSMGSWRPTTYYVIAEEKEPIRVLPPTRWEKEYKYKEIILVITPDGPRDRRGYRFILRNHKGREVFTWFAKMSKINKRTSWKEYKRMEGYIFMTLFSERETA